MDSVRYSFVNDYSEGADERVLEALVSTNREQTAGYGLDTYSARAREAIFEQLGQKPAGIHFLQGGTQTNLTFAAAVLRPHQGVVAAASGHISVHEAGAIEATGHKVLTIPSGDGKIRAEAVRTLIEAHYADPTAEHTVQPGMVYISHPTELGTLYTRAELAALSVVCDTYGIPLYMDGARLGCALAARDTDVTLPDIAQYCDAFYIGGTKMGALCGEALVIMRAHLNTAFRYVQKQHGAFTAKGRILGVQFLRLFTDGLYYELARHANRLARTLSDGIEGKGYPLLLPTETNQVFAILPKKVVTALERRFELAPWEASSGDTECIRLCTSWATDAAMVDAFLEALPEA